MGKFIFVILRKPLPLVLVNLAYLLAAGFLKWWISPPLGAIWFIVGGVIGIYFLDLTEYFFKLSPALLHSIVFEALFVVVSFFIITSSGGWLEGGLVLSLYLTMLTAKLKEWRTTGSLNSWFQMVDETVSISTQQGLLAIFGLIFLMETYLFIK